MTSSALYVKTKSLGSGGSMVARLKLKEIDGRAPPGVNKKILICKYCRYMLLKVDRPKLGAGRKRLLVKSSCALQQ